MLITEQYKQQISELHASDPSWGTTGRNFAPIVRRMINDWVPMNVLDYGCGKQTLSRTLPQFRIKGYDPGLPGLDEPPEPHDFVICTDVLEHIEPECLEDVLDDLQRVTRKNLFVQVCTVPSIAVLPDGRNSHLIVREMRWWVDRLWDRFKMLSFAATATGFTALVGAVEPKGNGSK